MFASFGETMYSLLTSLKTFGETMYSLMFSPLAETVIFLYEEYSINLSAHLLILKGLIGETQFNNILSSSLLSLTLTSFIAVYVLFTIIKYIVDIVS